MTSPADEALALGFQSLRETAGEVAYVQQASGQKRRLLVVFQEPAEIVTEGEPTVLTNPEAHLPTDEVENIAKGDSLRMHDRQKDYAITSLQADSIGVTRLILTET